MIWLILGLVLWTYFHLMKRVTPGLRERLGEPGKGVAALGSVVGIVLMVVGYRAAEVVPLYDPWPWAGHLNNLLMLIAILMFGVGSKGSWLATRMRHPQMVAAKIWAFAHLLVNGDLASVVLFGGLMGWAVASVILINRQEPDWTKGTEGPGRRDLMLVVVWLVLFAAIAWVHIWLGHNPFLGDYA